MSSSTATSTAVSPTLFSNCLSVYYHNCSGIRSKFKEIYLSLSEEDFDVICLAETWTTSLHRNEEFIPPEYIVFRRDRYLHSTTSNRGGGVLIAFSKKMVVKQLDISASPLEILAVRCKYHQKSFVFVLCYLPSNCPTITYLNFCQMLSEMISPILNFDDELIILGDFNLPQVDWQLVENEFVPLNLNEISSTFFDTIFGFGLQQRNQIRNTHGSLLDLIFTPRELQFNISTCNDLGNSFSRFHTPLKVDLIFDSNLNDINQCDNENSFFNFKKGDYVSLNSYLDNIDWEFISQCPDLDSVVENFYDVLKVGMDNFIPRQKIKSDNFREPWYNLQLINLKNKKSKAHKRYKRSRLDECYQIYSNLRKEFKVLNRFLYDSFILQIESDISNNPKKFWTFVDSKRKCSGFPKNMCYGSKQANNPHENCNLFASFFESVYGVNSNQSNNIISNSSCNNFSMIQFTESDIFNGLCDLDVTKGCGPDEVSPILLKNCASVLTIPLAKLYNKSLFQGYFPLAWKVSFIIPIFKSGIRADVANYRGIAILSTIPKLFEKLVKDNLFHHIKNTISTRQHGFYPGRSTTTNLAILTNFVAHSIEAGDSVQIVYTDFSKAFDKIDHQKLILKLDRLNCNYLPTRWISSYLSDRKQIVSWDNFFSKQLSVTSGVPQGSHLGPLLFNLFINDVLSCFENSECLIYADDLKIYKIIKNSLDAELFQSDLDNFSNWCQINQLCLNVNKCKTMNFNRKRTTDSYEFYLNDSLVNSVDSFTDLGVLFNTKLSFNDHVDNCVCKALSMLGFIKRFGQDFYDPYTLKTLYCSYVRSQLEYASVIWSPYYKNASERIESVQKKFLKYALRRLPRQDGIPRYILPSYSSRCQLMNLSPLWARREANCATFIRDILDGRIDCQELLGLLPIFVPARRLRNGNFSIRQELCLTNFGRSEPIFNAARAFNGAVEVFDFNIARDVYKKKVTNFILNA